MKHITSDALQEVNRILGITGAGSQETEFMDGTLDQVLDAGPLIRRGRTLGRSEGLWQAIMQNVHPVGAETIFSVVTPYNQTVGVINGYPALVPRGFDIWLLGAEVINISGGGVTTAGLFLNVDGTAQAFGEDDMGAAVVSSPHHTFAYWPDTVLQTFRVQDPVPQRAMRIPRGVDPGTSLTFSTTATLASTWECSLLLGLFPSALGQDGIG